MVNFSVQKCIGAEISYKSVITERGLYVGYRNRKDSNTFSFSKIYYSEL